MLYLVIVIECIIACVLFDQQTNLSSRTESEIVIFTPKPAETDHNQKLRKFNITIRYTLIVLWLASCFLQYAVWQHEAAVSLQCRVWPNTPAMWYWLRTVIHDCGYQDWTSPSFRSARANYTMSECCVACTIVPVGSLHTAFRWCTSTSTFQQPQPTCSTASSA